MKYDIRNDINIYKEILDLIYICINEEYEIKNRLDNYEKSGVDYKVFEKKYCDNINKYIKSFKKLMKINKEDADFYFTSEIDLVYGIGQILLTDFEVEELGNIIENIDFLTTEFLRDKLIKALEETFELENREGLKIDSLSHYINFINKLNISENVKWRFIKIYDDPKFYYEKLLKIISNNYAAFTKAYEEVKDDVRDFIKYLLDNGETNFKLLDDKYGIKIQENTIIYPSVVRNRFIEATYLAKRNVIYYGILFNKSMEFLDSNKLDNENLLQFLKAISDKSKFEIIKLLKSKKMYGQELAAKLDLSTATVSHHMNALLVTNIVKVKRENGKSYFYLNRESIKNFLKELGDNII